ncbi:DUF2188 domain-containing protein [uncultured Mitsuokella sp.]|uniref:DUF2188 domain-containing protein n=1 Tax=uncultured Mitsuokella sp. TaxID=453120 RepID=UPI00266F3409|nr:DUF2188 domain-containing protein [uncultured Mitsuokella sp.]
MPNQHVIPHGSEWAVKGEGNSRVTVVTNTKQEAIDRAREISKNQGTELVIHNRNGQISQKDSHGHDPYPPKG